MSRGKWSYYRTGVLLAIRDWLKASRWVSAETVAALLPEVDAELATRPDAGTARRG